jgi:hypothetical protein
MCCESFSFHCGLRKGTSYSVIKQKPGVAERLEAWGREHPASVKTYE